MTENGDLLALARRIVEAARPGEQVEAYGEWSRNARIEAYLGEVERVRSAEAQGLGVRLIVDSRLGYAYAADPDPDELVALVEQARANAAAAAPWEGNVLPGPEPMEPLAGLYPGAIERTPTETKVRLAVELDKAIRGADERVRAVPQAVYGEVIGRSVVASSSGVSVTDIGEACWAMGIALAGEGDETQTGWSVAFSRDPANLDVEATSREAADRATRLLGARKPKTERLPVLFDQMTSGDLIEILAAALSAEAVLKGRSLFTDKVGERVASEAFTLADDPRDVRGIGATPFDGEGVPTRRTPVIDRGVLTGFLHNASTAKRMGTRSTGNARRAGFKSTPSVGPHNFILSPGAETPEALLKRAGRALYVQDLSGVHSGVNPISGDFSVGVNGLMVEGGAFAAPVREATVASNLLDILTSVEAVGSDLRFLPSAAAAPTVLIGEMTVSGA